MKAFTHISARHLKSFNQKSQQGDGHEVLKQAIIQNGIEKVALNHESIINLQHTFSEEVKTGKATSQKISGRCWVFAGLNLFRPKLAEKLNVKDFELSQNYPMFFDKLEKANYFLESIIRTIDEDIYSRIVMWLLKDPLQDGGQWDMFANLVKKYGCVPQNIMPETYHSSRSNIMNAILTAKLREYAALLRTKYQAGKKREYLQELKGDLLQEFYSLLTYFLGVPPEQFDFEYRDKDHTFHADRNLTPNKFFKKYIKTELDDYVSLINAPTPDKPFNKMYSIDFLGNVTEGKPTLYLNVENDALKQATINQLSDGRTVWFGCDVRQQTEKQKGFMDTDIFLFDKALNTTFGMNKSDRLLFGESLLTHAMVFTGVNLVDGKPNRWKVENSWGEDRGEKGYFVMSDSWFDEYNYQVVLKKRYLPEKQQEILEEKPIVLPPWDPMGSLAMMH